MRRISTIALVLLLLVAAACGDDAPATTDGNAEAVGAAETAADTTDGGDVKVEELKFSLMPGGGRIVTGNLVNPTHDTVSAQVQLSLFDENNRRISSMSFLVRNVAPGEHKAFRQVVDDTDEARGARVRSILVL